MQATTSSVSKAVERIRRMKSYNHLYEQYLSDDNIKLAIINACKHKTKYKRFRDLKNNPEANIGQTRKYAAHFKNAKHTPIEIYDGIQRKKRKIIVPKLGEQIVHHMVVNVLKPIFLKSMYEHSYGSIPKRGGVMGMKTIKRWMTDHRNTKYCLKMDIRKYFDSVPHEIIIRKLTEVIHDERFLKIVLEIVSVTDQGLPLGFYTSQWFANWYLTPLDHYIKQELKAKYYVRYMDDMIIFGANKRKLHNMRVSVERYLHEELGLELKKNWQVFPTKSRALDFMGFRFFHDRITLRKSILQKARRKANRIRNKDRPTLYDAKQMLSYLGWITQTDTYGYYLKYIKPCVNIQYLKRRVSSYDKRMANRARKSGAAGQLCA